MQRRKFGREFKIEVVRLIKDRGASVAQASRYSSSPMEVDEVILYVAWKPYPWPRR